MSKKPKQGEINAKRFGDYCAVLAGRMCLYDWRLEVSYEPLKGEDNACMIDCVYGQKKAVISLSHEFHQYTREEQRHYMVHELVHCHMEQTITPIESVLSKDAYKIWTNAFEYSTDALAGVIAPLMPLPPKKVTNNT